MADAVENLERKGRGDEIFGAFGGSPADGVIGIAPDVECITRIGPSGERIAPRARYQAIAASIACLLPSTERCRPIAAKGTPAAVSRSRSHLASSARTTSAAPGSRKAL